MRKLLLVTVMLFCFVLNAFADNATKEETSLSALELDNKTKSNLFDVYVGVGYFMPKSGFRYGEYSELRNAAFYSINLEFSLSENFSLEALYSKYKSDTKHNSLNYESGNAPYKYELDADIVGFGLILKHKFKYVEVRGGFAVLNISNKLTTYTMLDGDRKDSEHKSTIGHQFLLGVKVPLPHNFTFNFSLRTIFNSQEFSISSGDSSATDLGGYAFIGSIGYSF